MRELKPTPWIQIFDSQEGRCNCVVEVLPIAVVKDILMDCVNEMSWKKPESLPSICL